MIVVRERSTVQLTVQRDIPNPLSMRELPHGMLVNARSNGNHRDSCEVVWGYRVVHQSQVVCSVVLRTNGEWTDSLPSTDVASEGTSHILGVMGF